MVKIHWAAKDVPDDLSTASALKADIDNNTWVKLMSAMKDKHPVSDYAMPTNGGDNRLDITLVPNLGEQEGDGTEKGYLGITNRRDRSKCGNVAVDISVRSNLPLAELISTVAHEMMHAVLFAFSSGYCAEYQSLNEATATWFEDVAHPAYYYGHLAAPAFLNTASLPLEDKG